MITDISDYFAKGCGRCARFGTPDCSVQHWAEGLAALRAICLETGLSEHVKWGQPCYMHAGRNIALIGAFRSNFCLSFFDAALLGDPRQLLEPSGPHAARADVIRFRAAAEVTAHRCVILSYLREAMGHAERGTRAPKPARSLELPERLRSALQSDPDLNAAFAALTPGRQRSYVIALASAKSPATQDRRIAKLRPRIIAGKGANER